jgi:hypothetical protein
VRRLTTLILVAAYLTVPVLGRPHAHADSGPAGRIDHAAHPHLHVGDATSHGHSHDHGSHDHHDHEHPQPSSDESDSEDGVGQGGSHHADALYLPSLQSVSPAPVSIPQSHDALPAGSVAPFVLAMPGLCERAAYWHPPSGARDGTDLYLKLRNLRI